MMIYDSCVIYEKENSKSILGLSSLYWYFKKSAKSYAC